MEEFFGTWNVDRLRICFREHHVRKKIAIYNIFCAIPFASIAFWLIEAWRSLLKQSRSDRVYNLWGAYSKEYTCPFVSPENWLEVAVYAGEKNYPLKKHSNN